MSLKPIAANSILTFLTLNISLWAAPLTNINVNRAVNQALDWTRKGGGPATVVGIREIPQENLAVADVRFDNFQFNANIYNIPTQKDEVTPPQPAADSPTFNQQMAEWPSRQRHVAQYTGTSQALLTHYNDGRWVLTKVNIGEAEINCNIAITDAASPAVKAPASVPRLKDGPLDAETTRRVRGTFGDDPMMTHDPWLEGRTVKVGLVKNGVVTAVLTGKCREDLTREDTKELFACHKGETIAVRIEAEMRYVGNSWEVGMTLSIKQLQP